MTARQEKVRAALGLLEEAAKGWPDDNPYERAVAPALAEVEEWETRLAQTEGFVNDWGDESLANLRRAEAAEAEVERWHREALDWQQAKSEADDAYDHAANRAMAAEAEADRLKAALDEIAKWDCPEGWGGAGFAHVRQIARAALAPADRNTA